ncbi:hypothetical protein ACFX2G_010485 [Malus domestica]
MTISNPKGFCEVSQGSGHPVLVCPRLHKGQVRVDHYGSKRTKFIVAHDSTLSCLGLTQDGRLLATASSKGTLIQIFNALDGSLLQEKIRLCEAFQIPQPSGLALGWRRFSGYFQLFGPLNPSVGDDLRRGAKRAEIFSLAFSSGAQWLAASSDKGTVHVFSVKVDSGSLGGERSSSSSESSQPSPLGISSLSFMKGLSFSGVLPKYFSSEWSVAKYHLPEGLRYTVAFCHQKNTVVILGMDGSFYRCQFDPVNVGGMTQIEYHNFLKPEETS